VARSWVAMLLCDWFNLLVCVGLRHRNEWQQPWSPRKQKKKIHPLMPMERISLLHSFSSNSTILRVVVEKTIYGADQILSQCYSKHCSNHSLSRLRKATHSFVTCDVLIRLRLKLCRNLWEYTHFEAGQFCPLWVMFKL